MREIEYQLKSVEEDGNSGYIGSVKLVIPKARELKKFALKLQLLLLESKKYQDDPYKTAELNASYMEYVEEEMLKYISEIDVKKDDKHLQDKDSLEYEMDVDLLYLELANFIVSDRGLTKKIEAKSNKK